MTTTKKSFDEMISKVQDRNDLIKMIVSMLPMSSISEDMKATYAKVIPHLTIAELRELSQILSKEIEDFTDLYMKYFEKSKK